MIRALRGVAIAWLILVLLLAEELVALSFATPQVQACRVSIVKPDIFNEVEAAGVEFFRVRAP